MLTAKVSLLRLFCICLSIFTFSLISAESTLLLNREKPEIHVDFNSCVSYFGGYNSDYSEFTGTSISNPDCTDLQLVGGSVYRLVPELNTHSCTPGVDSIAMCISGLNSCDFVSDSDKALRFDVLVMPGPEGIGSIEEVRFQAQAPENFMFVDGESGINDYPTLYGIRVTANGTEVFNEANLPTSRTWSEEIFDFSGIEGFMVEIPTIFKFEILPYCLVGNGSPVQAWDIDELYITGGCNDVNGGFATINESGSICYPEGDTTLRSFSVDMNLGNSFSWIVTNIMDEIVALPDSNSYDFDNLDNGIFLVYHLAYDSLDFSGLQLGINLNSLSGCFDLSNGNVLVNNKISASQLSVAGETEVYICNDDFITNTVELELSPFVSLSTNYLLFNEDSLILEVRNVPSFDFSNYGEGIYYIMAVHHNGLLFNAVSGMSLSSLIGCFVNSNIITVEKALINAGSISIDGGDVFTACESSSFELSPELVGSFGGTSRWLSYTSTGMITSIDENLPIDLSMMLFPSLELVHLNYLGNIEGLQLGEDIDDLSGCFDISNSIRIDFPSVDGGEISINGSDSLSICLNNPDEAILSFNVINENADSSRLVVTDEGGLILALSSNDSLDFSNAEPGICLVWNLAYSGDLNGLDVGVNVSSLDGCYDLSNSVVINRIELSPAELVANGGMTEFEVCSGDGIADEVYLEISSFDGPYSTYVVTDSVGNILDVTENDTLDFEGVPDGLCLIYHLVSSSDSLLNGVDLNINALDACYELSNPISIQRNEVNGGSIMTGDSLTEIFVVIGDAIADTVNVELSGSIGDSLSWVITDSLGNILALPIAPPFDFSDADAGLCYIYNISYAGELIGLQVGENVNGVTGCYDLSNEIAVNRIVLNGGVISFLNGSDTTDICTGDALIDSLEVDLFDLEGPLFSWVITDTSGMILDLPDSSPFIFDNTPGGTCFIYHIAYAPGLNGLLTGLNIGSLDGPFNTSNQLVVNRTQVNGGEIMTADSLTNVSFCTSDGLSDSLNVVLQGALGNNLQWIITDANNNILDLPQAPPFDFEGVAPGMCFIYHMSYSDTGISLSTGDSLDSLSGCYDLSNNIVVERFGSEGGLISELSGLDTIQVIVGEGVIDSFDFNVIDAFGDSLVWVITDSEGTILSINDNPPSEFESAGGGVCQIYHLAYSGMVSGLEAGLQIDDLMGCYDLSNSIQLERMEIDGGTISTSDSMTIVDLCIIEGESDSLDVLLEDEEGTTFQWLITDTSGLILALPAGPPFSFSSAGSGVCQIWHLSSIGTVAGLVVGENVNDLDGVYDFSNAVQVNRNDVDGGILTHSSMTDTITIITNDNISDIIDLELTGQNGAFQQWLITDSLGIILALPDSLPIDFEGLEAGVCLIWNLSYDTLPEGLEVDSSALALEGCFDLSNAFTVVREHINGGTIVTVDSTNLVELCLVDELSDSIDVLLSDASAMNFAWVITDTSGLILDLPTSPPFGFTDAGAGICLIWHLAYQDNLLGLAVGNNVSALDGSFNFSNSIEVNREDADGGILSHSSMNDSITIITNDNLADSIDLELTGQVGASQQWLITDSLGVILSLPDTLPFNFEGSDAGVCLIWNLSYNTQPAGLEIDSSALELEGCFDLSNAFTVIREHINGGTITTVDSTNLVELCLVDELSDSIDVLLSDASAMNFAWVITDTSGIILDLPASPPFGFADAGAGVCLIWHLAYQDNITGLAVGNNVNGLNGSYNFSNSIEVIRHEPVAGVLTLEGGMTSDTINVGDGIVDTISLVLNGQTGDNQIYLITDTDGVIMDTTSNTILDFESAGGGICLVWSVSYSDGVTGIEPGANANNIDGCFELSNPLTIVRMGLMGGVLTSLEGLTELQLCLSDTISDSFDVILTDTLGPFHTWVLTDTTGVIADLPGPPPFDLGNTGLDVCQLWNLSHELGIMGLQIGNNVDSLSGNFNFSNSITINKANTSGGLIMTTDSLTLIEITVGDGMIDTIDIILTGGEGDSSVWLVTDTLGNIMDLVDSPPFDFESASGGICQIWHLYYSSGLQGLMEGNNVSEFIGCFELSNPIQVNRTATIINGGVLTSTSFETEIEICVGSGPVTPIDVILNLNQGPNFQWVISDADGLILGLPLAPPFDLSLAGPGVCSIWHLSYANGIMGLEVGENINELVGFYDFSNPIVVTRNQADGGDIETIDGQTEITIPVGEGTLDSVEVTLNNEEGEFQSWIITDQEGSIQSFGLTPPFDFESAGGGVCLIWSLSYTGIVTGLEIGNSLTDLEGCFGLSNSITVNKDGLNGGILTDINGFSTAEFCQSSVLIDSLQVILTDTIGSAFQWVIVNTEGVIVDLPLADPFNLNNLPAGECFIYNLSYDTLPGGLIEGDSLTDINGVYHLSNALSVTKNEIFGGNLSFIDGELSDTIEVGDGVIDTVEVSLSSNLGSFSQWVVTDTFGFITELPVSDPFNFESAGGGICQIRNISFETGITGLTVGNNINEIQGCFELSNIITLFKNGLSGGILSFDDMSLEMEICFGDGVPDITSFTVQGSQGANQEILIARTNGQLFVVNAPNPFDFESIPINIDSFIIYNIAFDTMPGNYNQGNFISNLSGNYNLSNSILLIRDIEKGGAITDQDGMTSSTVITGDADIDTLNMILSGAFADSLSWVITDDSGIITVLQNSNEFIFDAPQNDICHIYHIGFNPDNISGLQIGESIDSLSGCFSLSNDYILTKKALNGGTLTTADGLTQVDLCIGDGNPDIVNLITTGELGAESLFVVVNLNGLILLNQTSSQIDMTSIQPGQCQIFHIVHDGSLSGVMNGINIVNISGCYDLSNAIDVNKDGVFGGNLQFQGGGLSREVCVTDAIDDNLIWQTSSVTGNYFYAITDTLNVIDTIVTANVFDFSDTEPGVSRIWGISYVGSIIAAVGDTIGVSNLVEDCFDVSNDFLVVTKTDCTNPFNKGIEYSVYPNPSIGQLVLRINQLKDIERSEWLLFDISGTMIHREKILDANQVFQINDLAPGLYQLRVISGGFVESRKVIVIE